MLKPLSKTFVPSFVLPSRHIQQPQPVILTAPPTVTTPTGQTITVSTSRTGVPAPTPGPLTFPDTGGTAEKKPNDFDVDRLMCRWPTLRIMAASWSRYCEVCKKTTNWRYEVQTKEPLKCSILYLEGQAYRMDGHVWQCQECKTEIPFTFPFA